MEINIKLELPEFHKKDFEIIEKKKHSIKPSNITYYAN